MTALRPHLESISQELETQAIRCSSPIWHYVTTRELAKILGVTVQALANWRVRDIGPPSRSASRGAGNKRLYRIDEVLSWLTGREAWTYTRDWLLARGIADEGCSKSDVEYLLAIMACKA